MQEKISTQTVARSKHAVSRMKTHSPARQAAGSCCRCRTERGCTAFPSNLCPTRCSGHRRQTRSLQLPWSSEASYPLYRGKEPKSKLPEDTQHEPPVVRSAGGASATFAPGGTWAERLIHPKMCRPGDTGPARGQEVVGGQWVRSTCRCGQVTSCPEPQVSVAGGGDDSPNVTARATRPCPAEPSLSSQLSLSAGRSPCGVSPLSLHLVHTAQANGHGSPGCRSLRRGHRRFSFSSCISEFPNFAGKKGTCVPYITKENASPRRPHLVGVVG